MSKKVLEAASVVVFNHAEQILFVKRPKSSKAWANMMVFPGGKVDSYDEVGMNTKFAHTSTRFFNAAIRELFEEVDVSLTTPPLFEKLTQTERRQWRHKIIHEKCGFEYLLQSNNCVPSYDKLVPFSRVITPLGSPHRFDTWFFLAQIENNEVDHVETNGSELEECIWLTPADALQGYSDGAYAFATPQLYLLHQFMQYDSFSSLWENSMIQAKQPHEATLPLRIPPSPEFPGTFTVFPGDPLYQPSSPSPFLHRIHIHPTDPSKTTVHLPPI